ncbi:hypothetical protein [uncultured Corynebacterium sp.]|uniref:hypothetical protein n=1 Tax=uncultured Corynebacterium sp. TaxID=159447 RepID=UPI0025EB7A27|nr:hypothetical protein [uncultured Corynebacterium sp.]
MTWWDDSDDSGDRGDRDGAAGFDGADGSATPIAPRLPERTPAPVPAELPDLVAFSRESARSLDHVSSWRAVTAFARHHWLGDAEGVPDEQLGEYHALRHAAADQLELSDEAEEARREWLDWAIRSNRPAAAFHARAFGAFAEAEKFIDARPGNARPLDSDVPELTSLTRDILDLRPSGSEAYQFALSAAVAGAAASLARRPDLAGALSRWANEYAPPRSGDDDRRLLEAQLAHGRGDVAESARICAAVAASPASEPVTSTIEARQMLAHLSLEAEEPAEAIRQLEPVVAAGLELDLVVGTLRSARLLTALLNSDGRFAEAADVASAALEAASGMPVNALVMDLRLILARSLLDSGADDEALDHAVPVAQWSSLTSDEERTDAAFSIAATAAGRAGDAARAADLLIEHAEHLHRLGDDAGGSRALRQAARSAVHDDPERAEDLMISARELISDGWSIADWHDDLAYVFWASSREDLALGHVDTAAAGYAEAGDGEEAARALLTGVRCCLDRDDAAGARRYAARIDELLPADRWTGHPVREALAELMDQ